MEKIKYTEGIDIIFPATKQTNANFDLKLILSKTVIRESSFFLTRVIWNTTELKIL